MSAFVKLASMADLPPGAAVEVVHQGRIVALFHVEGRVHAIEGICPHQGGPLAEGSCDGTIVTCPWHGWQFDVRDGSSPVFRRVRVPSFEVRVDGDDVLVDLP